MFIFPLYTSYSFIAANDQLQIAVEQLRIDNGNLQENYDDLMEDMNTAAEHRKRMEKNFNDNIQLQNKKIEELNQYINDLETRHARHKLDGGHSPLKSSQNIEASSVQKE